MTIYPPSHRDIQEAIDKTTETLIKSQNTTDKDLLRDHLRVLFKIQQQTLGMINTPPPIMRVKL